MTPPYAVALTDYDEWYAVHSTAWCHRMAAQITTAACDKQRLQSRSSYDELRCYGCGGLDQQPDPTRPVLTIIQGGLDQDGRGDREEIDATEPGETREQVELWEDSEEFDDNLEEIGLDLAGGTGGTVNALAAGLLAFMAGCVDEELSGGEPVREWVELPEPPERRGKVAVYVGRCIRCDGGMLHAAREGLDNAVYHCFNCGWYTSPAYEENRRAGARGW